VTFEYEGTRRLVYGDEGATFIPVCVKCGRFVRADETIQFQFEGPPLEQPNATCRKCGRTNMFFEGFISGWEAGAL
jgi:hypothetical protein